MRIGVRRGGLRRRQVYPAMVAGVVVVVPVVAAIAIRALERRAAPVAGMSTGRGRRTARLAQLSARASADYATMKARSAVASSERRQELQAEFELRSAEQVAEVLGDMKGALMKIGQMASYLDQGLPEPVRQALAELQTDAPPMAAELVDEVIRSELGRRPSEVFAEWETTPLASASIGQVHRAVTHDGRDVAVKVQYPGVEEAMLSDLDNGDLLFGLLSMMFPGMDPKPIVGEIRDRLVEELDYEHEAENQRLFADHFRGHPYIHVPDVIDDLSTRRVLTSELAEGARFSEVLTWSQEERDLAAECLFRFAFGGIYRLHAFNGDPHPGNYLFRPGGHVTFLDFGLCKRFTPDEVRTLESMILAFVIHHDLDAYREILVRTGILTLGDRVTDEMLEDYFGHFYEFVMADEVMELTPEYASETVRRFFDLGSPYAETMKSANLPPSMVIIQRINLGLYALFGELHASANWRRIAEELWPFAHGEPSTPMGETIAAWESSARPVA